MDTFLTSRYIRELQLVVCTLISADRSCLALRGVDLRSIACWNCKCLS